MPSLREFTARMRGMCRMCGSLISRSDHEEIKVRPLHYPLVPFARNIWSFWTDDVMKRQGEFGFMSVAIFSGNGLVNMNTDSFLPTSADIRTLNDIYNRRDDVSDDDSSNTTVTFNHCTYVVKTLPMTSSTTSSISRQPDVVTSCCCSDKSSGRHQTTTPLQPTVEDEPRQLLAFNGSRYLLVTRSRTLYIVTLIDTRRVSLRSAHTVDDALVYITGLGRRLIEKGY